MRILVLNSNTNQKVTKIVTSEAVRSASEGTEIVSATGQFGCNLITSRTALAIAEHATMARAASLDGDFDAILLAVSLEPGLLALKERFSVPVLGMTEAALLTAATIGGKAGVLTFPARSIPMVRELIAMHGFQEKIAVVRAIPSDNNSYTSQDKTTNLLRSHAQKMAAEDFAESIVLIGAATTGIGRKIQKVVPVPVIDGISCGVRMLEALAKMELPHAKSGSFSKILIGDTLNLSSTLNALASTD